MGRDRGFAVPLALALVAMLALLAGDAFEGASSSLALANLALARERAFDAAETGVARASHTLDSGESAPLRRVLALGGGSSVTVDLRPTLVDSLPEGFSAGRFRAERYSLRSTGTSTQARVSIDAGLTRLVPRE